MIDSLRRELAHAPRDTHRVSLLNLLASEIQGAEVQEALDLSNEAIALCDSLRDQPKLAASKAQFAELQMHIGAYDRSMKVALEANEIFSALKDTNGLARTFMSVALVQNQMRMYDKAIENFQRAESMYLAAGRLRGQISARHNLAVVLAAKLDTAAALAQYRENLQLLLGTGKHLDIIAATYNNIGNSFGPNVALDSAVLYYNLALKYKFMAKTPNKSGIGNTYMNLASVYLKHDQVKMATLYLDSAQTLVMESQDPDRMMDLYTLQGEINFALGNFKESALSFQKLAKLQDSLFTPQITEQTAKLEAAFQNENQKKEIALLNQSKALNDIEKTRWQWITTGVVIGLVLTITLLVVVVLRGRERARMWRLLHSKGDEIKRQQQEILLQNEALSLQNQRLEKLNHEKDGLIGIVAHDIRAPLNRSAALAALIEELGSLSPEQTRYLQMIRKVSDDGGKLIQDLLELNSYEQNAHKVELNRVDLKLVLEHSWHGFQQNAASKGIVAHFDVPSTAVVVDEKLLGRILDNIISNAVKFSPKGKALHFAIKSDADRQWISIRDEGPGISPADQKLMFQKFQRLSARPTGGENSTGLGLSIIKALADRIGVELRFESEVGKGTTFLIGIRKNS